METALIIATTLGFILTASLGFCWVFARLYCRPKQRSSAVTPKDEGLPFEHVTFTSGGRQLAGWFVPYPSNPAPHPVIVVAHGWSGFKGQMLPLARELHAAGFNLFLYDARGHGNSEPDGPITIVTFAEDLAAAVDFMVERPGLETSRLGVVGHSLGGAAAIVAASTDSRIGALVSSSAFENPASLTRRIMRAKHLPRGPFLWVVCRIIEHWLGAPMRDVAPSGRIGKIAAPILLIHGDADDFVPPTDLEVLWDRAPRDRTQRWVLHDGRHSDVIRDSAYCARVADFFEQSLTQSTGE